MLDSTQAHTWEELKRRLALSLERRKPGSVPGRYVGVNDGEAEEKGRPGEWCWRQLGATLNEVVPEDAQVLEVVREMFPDADEQVKAVAAVDTALRAGGQTFRKNYDAWKAEVGADNRYDPVAAISLVAACRKLVGARRRETGAEVIHNDG